MNKTKKNHRRSNKVKILRAVQGINKPDEFTRATIIIETDRPEFPYEIEWRGRSIDKTLLERRLAFSRSGLEILASILHDFLTYPQRFKSSGDKKGVLKNVPTLIHPSAKENKEARR